MNSGIWLSYLFIPGHHCTVFCFYFVVFHNFIGIGGFIYMYSEKNNKPSPQSAFKSTLQIFIQVCKHGGNHLTILTSLSSPAAENHPRGPDIAAMLHSQDGIDQVMSGSCLSPQMTSGLHRKRSQIILSPQTIAPTPHPKEWLPSGPCTIQAYSQQR